MKIKQNKRSTEIVFTFNDESFNYAYEDKSGSEDLDINYASLPKKSAIQIEENEWLRSVGYLWCALGIFTICYALFAGNPLKGTGFWFLIGLACVIWVRVTKIKYTVLRTPQGNVFIIQNKNHDEIINTLTARKIEQLLDWHGEINMNNDPDEEKNKFQWLVSQHVLTQEQADEKIALIEQIEKDRQPVASERLN